MLETTAVKATLSVARNKSFTIAAKELYLSQSTISKKIRGLEEELGIRFFERKTRSRVALTAEGETLLPFLRTFDKAGDQLIAQARIIRQTDEHSLVVGCVKGWSTFGEDEIILDFARKNPHISLQELSGSIPELAHELSDRTVDVMIAPFVKNGEYDELLDIRYAHERLWDLRLKIAIRSNHPAVEAGCVSLSALRDEVFLFKAFRDDMLSDPKIRCFFTACHEEGFEPQVQFTNARTSMMLGMVASGQGVAPLMFAPTTNYPGVNVVLSQKDHYHFTVKAIWQTDNTSSDLVLFMKHLKSYAGTTDRLNSTC